MKVGHMKARWRCVWRAISLKKHVVRSLEQQWEAMLRRYDGIPCFHMVDCFKGVRHFKGWPRERRTALEEEVIKIIRAHAIYAIVVLIDQQAIDMLLQYSQEQAAMIQGSQGPLATVRYSFMVRQCFDRSKIGLKRPSIPGMFSPCLNRCQKIMEKFRMASTGSSRVIGGCAIRM